MVNGNTFTGAFGNLGTNVGSLASSLWSGTLTAADLQTLYDQITANAGFASKLSLDVAAVTRAASGYKTVLGCSAANPPAWPDTGSSYWLSLGTGNTVGAWV